MMPLVVLDVVVGGIGSTLMVVLSWGAGIGLLRVGVVWREEWPIRTCLDGTDTSIQ